MSSLIEYDANLPAEADYAVGSFDEGESSQTSLLALAWQARWLMLLTTLLGVGGSWMWLQRVETRFTSESQIYIERNLPRVLNSDLRSSNSASYLYTQAELIRSTSVLAAVADAPENAQLETFRTADNRVGLLKKQLRVQVGNNSDIISVSIELPVAEDAAQIVNSVVDAYTNQYAENHRTNAVDVLKILRSEKQRLDSKMERNLQALDTFRGQNAALAVRVGAENVITKRFAAFASELDRVELALIDAKTLNNRTQKMLKDPSSRPFLLELAGTRHNAAHESRVESQLLLSLEKQIQDLELQIHSLRATWGDGHTRVKLSLQAKEVLEKRLADQKASVEKRKETIVAAYVETVAHEYQSLEQKREELERNYDKQYKLAIQVSAQAAKLAALENALSSTEKYATALDQQINKVNLTEGVGAMNVSIIEKARSSGVPTYPVPARFLALGSLLGGLFGFGLTWMRDLLDHRLKSIDQITSTLQLSMLGALPTASGRLSLAQVGMIMVHQPQATLSEAFRSLRTSLHFDTRGKASKVIAVTSASPGEGKSVVASNLAIALAQLGRKVLLIDADLRRSSQCEIFAIEADRGLSSVLSERHSVENIIVPTSIPQLDLLPSGPAVANPVDLLNSGYFDDLLDNLSSEYDRIVIDSTSLLSVADTRIIAALSDSVLLVLQADRSTRQDSLAARDQLRQVGVNHLAVVVNRVPVSKQADYGQSHEVLGHQTEKTPRKRDAIPVSAVITDETPVA